MTRTLIDSLSQDNEGSMRVVENGNKYHVYFLPKEKTEIFDTQRRIFDELKNKYDQKKFDFSKIDKDAIYRIIGTCVLAGGISFCGSYFADKPLQSILAGIGFATLTIAHIIKEECEDKPTKSKIKEIKKILKKFKKYKIYECDEIKLCEFYLNS